MAEVRSLIPAVWNVPEVFRKRLGETVGRQRLMQADGHLLLVLHRPPGPEDDDRAGRLFWRSPAGEWRSNELGDGPNALHRHLQEYTDLVETIEKQDDAAATSEDYFRVLYLLAPILRAARNLQSVLQEAREASPEDRSLINARDAAYRVERMSELLYTDAKNSLEFEIARRAEQQARNSQRMAESSHRLNLLAAFFLPLATFASLFGTNLRHGFEEVPPPFPFLICIAAGLLSGIVLMGFVVRGGGRRRSKE